MENVTDFSPGQNIRMKNTFHNQIKIYDITTSI